MLMSYAPNYNPTTSFADDETNSVAGRSTVKTDRVDTEFANVSTSLNALNANLKALQRDDSKLKDMIVEPYALAEATRAMLVTGGNPRGLWAASTAYAKSDIVQNNVFGYICWNPHTSGLAFDPANWIPLSGDGQASIYAAQAQGYLVLCDASADAADASADAAALSAMAADASADAAALSATAAANSAVGANSIHDAPTKPTPIDADEIGIWDSVSALLRRVNFAELKTWVGGFALLKAGGTMTGAINMNGAAVNTAKSTVASATTPDIWTGTGNFIDYTGTANATGFAAAPQAGAERLCQAAGSCSFTLGANLISKGWASGEIINLSANDLFTVKAITTTLFAIILHQPVTGTVTASGVAFTFVTPGNLSVSYSARDVTYSRFGNRVSVRGQVSASTFTHTTASGNFRITGAMPFLPSKETFVPCVTDGTWAISGMPSLRVKTDGVIDFEYVNSTSGQRTGSNATVVPTGSGKTVNFNFTYEV